MIRAAAAACLLLLTLPAAGWDSSRLSVPLIVDDDTVPYPVFAIYVMPGQSFRVGLADGSDDGTVEFLERLSPLDGTPLRAPTTPGLHPLKLTNTASGETAVINVFTLTPADELDPEGRLNGYKVGRYPTEPLKGLDIYRPPPGFIEVTEDIAATRVSPNFELRQFVCKQTPGFPSYVTLRKELLHKLEDILAMLNLSGRPTRGLVVMSGFRTPFYNQAIGNVPYSRHIWGGAADVYVDEAPADGRMDDLNRDGRVDRNDAHWLADFVNQMSHRGDFGPRIGGLGVYGSNAAHGPFIHVDVRGSRARW